MIRTKVMGVGLLAVLVLAAHGTAGASTCTLTGVGQATLTLDCQNAFKIPFAGTSTSEGTWTVGLAAAEAQCILTWGDPIAFQGVWNPVTGSDFMHPTSCLQSMDPTRPGFYCLGAIPAQGMLSPTTFSFCVRTACFQGTALAERS